MIYGIDFWTRSTAMVRLINCEKSQYLSSVYNLQLTFSETGIDQEYCILREEFLWQGMLTPHYELLSLDSGIALGSLQQSNPVVHLFWSLRVTVKNTVSGDDHKRIGSIWGGGKEEKACFGNMVAVWDQNKVNHLFRCVSG